MCKCGEEIEITPEMIKAGVRFLEDYPLDYSCLGPSDIMAMAEGVLRRALAVCCGGKSEAACEDGRPSPDAALGRQ